MRTFMARDPYGPCPCGSGKKFKWCCQPIHVEIDKAFQQFGEGQYEAALRTMDAVAAQHPDNPEVYGRKAQLLYELERPDEAEAALQKALDLNPGYPFGHYLRGQFRRHEGEFAGALLLFRKAAELYDPEARDILGMVYANIAECEMRLNRPVAARAATEMALRHDPGLEVCRQNLDKTFGPESHLPLAARQEYRFQSPGPAAPPARRPAWQRALQQAATGKLSDAKAAFEQLTGEDASDAAAWYNLGLVRAWLGENAEALEALERYVALEPDENKAAAAWTLGEVLRCGAGMEDRADYVEHSAFFEVRDPQRLVNALETLVRERRFIPTQSQQAEGVLLGLFLEPVQALTTEQAARKSPHLGAFVLIVGTALSLRSLVRDRLRKVIEELQQRAPGALSEAEIQHTAAPFADLLSEGAVFPLGVQSEEEARQRVAEGFQEYFEDQWLHRPLHALDGASPLDAAGHAPLRKKLLGVIAFLQQCAEASAQPYDFDRLRRKLGLLGGPATSAAEPADISAMGTAELAGLSLEALTEHQLEQAYQTALRLDARELARHFAQALVGRPPPADRPDRFPIYNQLIQQALAEGNTDSALAYVSQGEQADRAHNEGRRQNDYELRRGQILAKRGETDAAQDVFARLLERVPAELKYAAAAAEAMLSARRGPQALRFAEAGLAQARKQNNRDSEEHFKELVAAAHKQGA
jgi:tetratricopeptide (TPR) repeat protein